MATHGGLVRVTVYFPAEVAEGVAVRARALRQSMSAAVCVLVEGALSEPGVKAQMSPASPGSDSVGTGVFAPPAVPASGSESVSSPAVLGEGAVRDMVVETLQTPGRATQRVSAPSPSTSHTDCAFDTPRGLKCKSCGQVHR